MRVRCRQKGVFGKYQPDVLYPFIYGSRWGFELDRLADDSFPRARWWWWRRRRRGEILLLAASGSLGHRSGQDYLPTLH